jgi:hypothetical protein
LNPSNPLSPLNISAGIHPAVSLVVSGTDRSKPYIDVMENVFGGVRISTDKDPRSCEPEPDLRGRPWLTGVSMSEVNVTLAGEDDEPER